jgi:hypothetical protein
MRDQDTICYKVSEAIRELENTVATNSLNVGRLAKLLHGIRQDAQTMENGLKLRKSMMSEAGIEDKYQEAKGKARTPGGINKIHNKKEYTKGKTQFEFIIKDQKTGETVYQNASHGGVISTVERIEDIDKDGHIDGQAQVFQFGHTLVYWFAYDQLRQAIEARKVQIISAIKEAILSNKLSDPKVRKQIVGFVNQIERKKNARHNTN